MRVLLDTHAFLWAATRPERLGASRDLIEDAETELLLSAASSWEIAIKYRIGRLALPEEPAAYMPVTMRRLAASPLVVEHSHALHVASLPDLHRDPFDRLLVAQAQLLDLPIVTADAAIAAYDIAIVRL